MEGLVLAPVLDPVLAAVNLVLKLDVEDDVVVTILLLPLVVTLPHLQHHAGVHGNRMYILNRKR